MILFAPPVTEGMLLARGSLQTMRDRFPKGHPTLTWVLPSAGLSMESEARRAAATVTQEFSEGFTAQATLIEGSGFQAATVRAIISGIDMVARSRAPKKVFDRLLPCVEWCAPLRTVSSPPASVLFAALDSLRGSLG